MRADSGALADLFGRKRLFLIGIVRFTVASTACGLSTDALFLIIARGVQGIGGAMMFATGLALISQEFHGKERGTAIGVWGATIGAADAIGPLAGGALTSGSRGAGSSSSTSPSAWPPSCSARASCKSRAIPSTADSTRS